MQDLGKALGLPKDDLRLLSKQLGSHDAVDLRGEMLALPAFRERVDAPGWRDLLALGPGSWTPPAASASTSAG